MTISWRALWPTPTLLRLAIVPVLAFLATITDRNYLADFWHHLARGRAIVEQGSLVDHDLFTFTVAKQPFQDVNWLTQVAFYYLHEAGGLSFVQLVNSLVIALTMLLLVNVCTRRAGSLLAGVIAGGIAFLGVWEVLTIRPQTLSMLFFVVVFDLLDRSERQRWLLVLPPLLIALWANLHGAFPLGIVLVACFTLAAARQWTADGGRWTVMLTACLVACVLASFVNPYGWDVYRYVGATAKVAYDRGIAEWVSPTPDRLIGMVWMVSVVAVFGLLAWRWWQTRRLPALRDCLLLGCFLAASAGSVRMVPWWMLISAPVLAELFVWLAPKLAERDDESEQPSLAVAGVFSLVMLAVIFSLPGLAHLNPLLGPTRRGQRVEDDLEAVNRHLRATATTGNIYSHFEWGEYLSWSAAPRWPIFMDGRIEIYPDVVWNKYTTVTFGREGWEEILQEYRVNYLILDANYHSRAGLLTHVVQSSNWHQSFQSRFLPSCLCVIGQTWSAVSKRYNGFMSYAVKEIFYTLQGEGANTGRPAVFCRFAGCNLWTGLERDRASAICSFCDTEFVGTDGAGGGSFANAKELAEAVAALWPIQNSAARPLVVCTGGEPLLQMDDDLINAFHARGFEIAIETNGTRIPPDGLDWICVSPKAGTEWVLRSGNELKLIFPQGGAEPELFENWKFQHFFLQPMDGPEREPNTKLAIQYCLQHPRWRLSLQTQKLLGIP